ncbi:hypothetical protein METP3_00236 [Methanosarcinales archaeon]|nr:hypothetical protein METP3_00236 [Methanosarcinales archaeon]
MDNDSSWAERFYTHFLGRDLSYLFAGGLFITIVQYALHRSIYLPRGMSLELLGYLLGSYFLGLAISEFSVEIQLVQKKSSIPNQYSEKLLFYQDFMTKFKPNVVNRYERTIYLMHVGSSVGVAALYGSIFMLFMTFYRVLNSNFDSLDYIGLALGLGGYGIFMIIHSRKKWQEIHEHQKALSEYLKPCASDNRQ